MTVKTRKPTDSSFSPYAWWPDALSQREEEEIFTEIEVMWVYRKVAEGKFVVGFFSPSGDWYVDTEYSDRERAAERVRYLMGGS